MLFAEALVGEISYAVEELILRVDVLEEQYVDVIVIQTVFFELA